MRLIGAVMRTVFSYRDGRFRLGDEIINVNGKSLRGLSMEEAKTALRAAALTEVDIILAREPQQQDAMSSTSAGPALGLAANGDLNALNNHHTPVERRKRRKLPMIERPRSAPIHHQVRKLAVITQTSSHSSVAKLDPLTQGLQRQRRRSGGHEDGHQDRHA